MAKQCKQSQGRGAALLRRLAKRCKQSQGIRRPCEDDPECFGPHLTDWPQRVGIVPCSVKQIELEDKGGDYYTANNPVALAFWAKSEGVQMKMYRASPYFNLCWSFVVTLQHQRLSSVG